MRTEQVKALANVDLKTVVDIQSHDFGFEITFANGRGLSVSKPTKYKYLEIAAISVYGDLDYSDEVGLDNDVVWLTRPEDIRPHADRIAALPTE